MGVNRISCVEDETRKNSFRRSIVTTRLIKKGEIINIEDLDFKRPGIGIEPGMLEFIIGRTANKDLEADKPFTTNDLL